MTVDLDTVTLGHGLHRNRKDGLCVMELVAWIADEPHSDRPECACPVIAGLMIRLNDSWTDADRQLLKPYALKVVGTRSTREVETRRRWVMVDWSIRTFLPAMLDLAGLDEHATVLRALGEIRDAATASASRELVVAARRASQEKRRDAADAYAYAAAAAADAANAVDARDRSLARSAEIVRGVIPWAVVEAALGEDER